MNEQELLGTIIASAYSRDTVQRRLRYTRAYLEHWFYSTDTKLTFEDFLNAKHASADDIEAMSTYGKEFFAAITKDTMYKILDNLTAAIKLLPSVNVYIPYEATQAEVVKMGKWFRKNVNPSILVELHTDPTLLGGCAFAWQGIYRDYSLRHYMFSRRQDILNLITSYAQKTG